jgi:hypothetical protein
MTSDERRFITREIRQILTERPHISAKLLCEELGISYNKYRRIVYNERWKLMRSRATPSSPSRVYHALALSADIGPDAYSKALATASREKCFGRWYVTDNRNRQLAFVNDWILAWLWPTGRYRAQLKRDVSKLQDALAWAKVTLLALGLSEDAASAVKFDFSRHRVFYIGKQVPQFRINEYRKPLGLEIYADGSHPMAVETTETTPDWFSRAEATLNALHQGSLNMQQLLKAMAEEIHYLATIANALLREEKPEFDRSIYY